MTADRVMAGRGVLAASALLALLGFVALGVVLATGAQWSLERDLVIAWQGETNEVLRWTMVAVSYIGFIIPFLPIVVGVELLLWRFRGPREAIFVAAPSFLAYVTSFLAKLTVRRPRPDGEGIDVHIVLDQYGYPSQHVLSYTVFFGLLGYLAWRRWPPGPGRWLVVALCGLLVLAVGPSRVYLGAHWPTDVIGGYLLGYAFWALAVLVDRRALGTKGSERAD